MLGLGYAWDMHGHVSGGRAGPTFGQPRGSCQRRRVVSVVRRSITVILFKVHIG